MSVYAFRFKVIEDITRASTRIQASFNRMTAAAGSFGNRINRVPQSIDRLEAELKQLRRAQAQSFDTREIRRYGREIGAVQARIRRLRGEESRARGGGGLGKPSLGGIGGGAAAAIAAVAAVGVVGADIVKTTMKAEGLTNAIEFTSRSSSLAAERIQKLGKTVEWLGLPLEESMVGFKTLDASLLGTGITAAQSDDIFRGVSVGVSAMNLSAEDAQGVFLALGQVASKGKVQAEELRGQIGERLPGAFNIAARAMGVTGAELDKMMEQGKLTAKDFLPKFAAEIERTFAGALPKSVNSAQASFNRFNNSIYRLKVAVGQQLMPLVLPAITKIADTITKAVEWIGSHKAEISAVFEGIGAGIGVVWAKAQPFLAELSGYWESAKRLAIALYPTIAAIGDAVQGFVVPAFNILSGAVRAIFDSIAAFVQQNQSTITAIVEGVGLVLKAIGGMAIVAFKILSWVFDKLWWVFGGIITFIKDALFGIVGWLWDNVLKPILKMFAWVFDMVGKEISMPTAAADAIVGEQSVVKTDHADSESIREGDASRAGAISAAYGKNGANGGGSKGTGAGGGLNDQIGSVSGGGREGVRHVTINIAKQIESLVFQNVKDLNEATSIIRREVENALLTASNDKNYAQ